MVQRARIHALFTFAPAVTEPIQAVIAANINSGTAPVTVSFDGASSEGNVVSYLWDFGDSGTGSGADASHAYTSAGTFLASPTVVNSNGQSDTVSTTVTVSALW